MPSPLIGVVHTCIEAQRSAVHFALPTLAEVANSMMSLARCIPNVLRAHLPLPLLGLADEWICFMRSGNIPREEPMSVIQWTALSFGGLLLLSQVQEPTQDSKFHLAEVSCKTFTEFSQQEQAMIMSWLQGYYLPEHAPAIIDLKKLLSDKAKLTEHCINQPEDDLMTAAEAVMRQ